MKEMWVEDDNLLFSIIFFFVQLFSSIIKVRDDLIQDPITIYLQLYN
uniref:Uncharacterized protein n=1 Tax=Lepeophtheirus salmonis TaxID=72036 RepID=A0A0K2TRZ6_LEPSM